MLFRFAPFRLLLTLLILGPAMTPAASEAEINCPYAMKTDGPVASQEQIARIRRLTYSDSYGELRNEFFGVLQFIPMDAIQQIMRNSRIRYNAVSSSIRYNADSESEIREIEDLCTVSAIFVINHAHHKHETIRRLREELLRHYGL